MARRAGLAGTPPTAVPHSRVPAASSAHRRQAIEETDRRRALQQAHNARHGIRPTPIVSAGEGSGLMLDLLDEAKARRERAAKEPPERGRPPLAAPSLVDEPAARAAPAWLVVAMEEQAQGMPTMVNASDFQP